ncbi:MAG: class F sortase, partial [Acidimicrobiales bacterium]
LMPLLLIGAACSNVSEPDGAASGGPVVSADSLGSTESLDSAASSPEVTTEAGGGSAEVGDGVAAETALADLITELPPAPTGLPEPAEEDPRPVGLTIEALGVEVASVIGVGVESDGDMEIPPADEVGWYRYGPTPGQQGSAVLAAHIAYEGTDGVFVDLDELPLGSVIAVDYDDGSSADFVAVSKEQYDKAQLPRDDIFARSGQPQLVLITCGGDFNRRVRSYDDNVVVYAEAIDTDR